MTKFVVGFIGTPDHLGTACLPSSMNQGLASVRKDFFPISPFFAVVSQLPIK